MEHSRLVLPEDSIIEHLKRELETLKQTRIESPKKDATLRNRSIEMFDRLGKFEKEWEVKLEIKPEHGESEEDFLSRQFDVVIKKADQMSAAFRLNLEQDMRRLNDEIQVIFGNSFPLLLGIGKAGRSCNGQTIQDMRETLWACIGAMDK
jgi:hypothetical protein